MVIIPKQATALGNRTRLKACSDIYSTGLSGSILMIMSNRFLICGAGRFGSRVSNFLFQDPKLHVTAVDRDTKQLRQITNPSVIKIQADIIDFLARKCSSLHPDTIIIPAVPIHLAFEWLLTHTQDEYVIRRIDIPSEISGLPHSWLRSRQELICTYADFFCPENCPEPEDICTVTQKRRGTPLFELISTIKIEGFQTGVVRSRQMGPGWGGYTYRELLVLKERIIREGKGKWLIGTACRCHGILSACELIKQRSIDAAVHGSTGSPLEL